MIYIQDKFYLLILIMNELKETALKFRATHFKFGNNDQQSLSIYKQDYDKKKA